MKLAMTIVGGLMIVLPGVFWLGINAYYGSIPDAAYVTIAMQKVDLRFFLVLVAGGGIAVVGWSQWWFRESE